MSRVRVPEVAPVGEGRRPIGGFRLTRAELADMAAELHEGIPLARHLGRRTDTGRLRPEQVGLGKPNNVREAIEICGPPPGQGR